MNAAKQITPMASLTRSWELTIYLIVTFILMGADAKSIKSLWDFGNMINPTIKF